MRARRTAALTLTSVLMLGLAADNGPAQPAKETAVEDTAYLLQPFMVQAAARRGEIGPFEIIVTGK